MHFQVIENLLEKQYGMKKTSIILWWVFESLDDEGRTNARTKTY